MSFWQRISTDANNAVHDVYSHWVLGDDAGKSALVTLVYQPSHPLGMTFLEINGRAYVKSVTPGSAADQAGVLPQDAVQLAVALRPEWVKAAAATAGGDEDEDTMFDDATTENHQIARNYALHLEKKGRRTTYDQLLRLISKSLLHGNVHVVRQHFLSPPVDSDAELSKITSSTYWNGPSIPSTICAPIMAMSDTDSNTYLNFERRGSSSSDSDSLQRQQQQQPIILVFRRTRQRQSTESSCFMPASFRLDDECDLACSLVRRLAPTGDMEAPVPDTWEELVHDGTDWLLGKHSMLPPKHNGQEVTLQMGVQENHPDLVTDNSCTNTIPLDDFERVRAKKLATLRSRITAEAMLFDRTEDVEAATVRAMIQKAVGLAFVRASKVVLGVSIHGGSGIVISRLSDGTWSAPSAIGTWGLGLGLQFGLEVAEYIFILQTQEAMQHFRSGGSYTLGGNMGIAVAGIGREAYGAASVGGGCGSNMSAVAPQHDDEYNDENDDSRNERQYHPPQSLAIAPIVAYAKSQGLYVGVSLEGSRIFTRDDINCRTYKFAAGRNVTANDILSGKVPTPPEAEDLYAALHSVEFTHEMSCLPRPPEILRKDSANAWTYDKPTLVESMNSSRTTASSDSSQQQQRNQPFSFVSKLTLREAEECEAFEAQFKNFMYGGVSVQRLLTGTEGRSDRTGKERRTLWLMLPEVGSLRLGFVSKLSDGEGAVSNQSSTQRARRDDPSRASVAFDGDLGTVGSEDLTLDSALQTRVSGHDCFGSGVDCGLQVFTNYSLPYMTTSTGRFYDRSDSTRECAAIR
jgi:lipid-binding SYLF domain-containing protein